MRSRLSLIGLVLLCSCAPSQMAPDEARPDVLESQSVSPGYGRSRSIRLTGVLEAVRSTRIVVPQLTGPSRRMTLTRIIPNGSAVMAGDIVAEFAGVEQIDLARESAGSYEDLNFQVRQKEAENRANVERRRSARQQAEADHAKALLEVSKAEILSVIEADQNVIRAEKARLQIESLARSDAEHDRADAAALRILELQRDRQRAAFEQAEANLDRLRLPASIGGMVAHATRYSNGSMVRPQEGDQMNRNNALLSIFDPTEMRVRASVAEPDGALLKAGLEATVYIDAYPDLALRARFASASPVASAGFGNGIKTFTAVFTLVDSDSRLMPDLSAAVVFESGESDGLDVAGNSDEPPSSEGAP
jgi:multidrug efflux pump subunit AcrA (membrane-fusion protein)